MAGRRELLRDEAARSAGKTLGFAPLVGLAGLLFGLSLTTHRTPVIVASVVALVVPFIATLVTGRDLGQIGGPGFRVGQRTEVAASVPVAVRHAGGAGRVRVGGRAGAEGRGVAVIGGLVRAGEERADPLRVKGSSALVGSSIPGA